MELRILARASYEFTETLLGHTPTPNDCEGIYSVLLLGSDLFRGMVARKRHLSPAFYEAMSIALAKYVLHTDWDAILILGDD